MMGRPRPTPVEVMPGPQDYRQLIAPLGKDKPAFTIQKR